MHRYKYRYNYPNIIKRASLLLLSLKTLDPAIARKPTKYMKYGTLIGPASATQQQIGQVASVVWQ